jgi:integrase
MRKVADFDYLYLRGDSYVVRVQVPQSARKRLGVSELKKALGGDLAEVRRRYHQTVGDFRRRIDSAVRAASSDDRNPLLPNEREIDQAARAYHFGLRDSIGLDGPDDALYTGTRLASVQRLIAVHEQASASRAFNIMQLHAQWLCEDSGWVLDQRGKQYQSLCEKLLRARLEFLRKEEHRLRALFSPRSEADPLFHPTQAPRSAARTQSVGDLIDAYKREQAEKWAPSTAKNYTVSMRALEELVGRDTSLGTVDREMCRSVRGILADLPPSYRKRPDTRDLSLADAAAKARKLHLARIQPATLNAYLSKLSALFEFAVREGWIEHNPASRLLVSDAVSPAEKRDPFSPAQLQSIFSSSPWLPEDRGAGGRPARFWVPLLGLFTGARVGELAQLHVGDVQERDGVSLIMIRSGDGRRLKTANAVRSIPVHSELAKIGFLDFARSHGERKGRLFPEEQADGLGHYGRGVSDWFARLLKLLGFKERRLTFHSLRHNFEDRLREADLHGTAIGAYLTGRAGGGVARNYGSGFSSQKLAHAVEQVRYPRLDLSHLYLRGAPSSLL